MTDPARRTPPQTAVPRKSTGRKSEERVGLRGKLRGCSGFRNGVRSFPIAQIHDEALLFPSINSDEISWEGFDVHAQVEII